jgi:hypothetical protein
MSSRTSAAVRLATVAALATVTVGPSAQAAPSVQSSRTSCTGWHDVGYTVWQSRLCVNVTKYSSGDVRLMSTAYGRNHRGGNGGEALRARASLRRGSGGTAYRSDYHYAPDSGNVPVDKVVRVARVSHYFTSTHATAYAGGAFRGTLPTSSGPMSFSKSLSVSRAY